MSIRMLLLGRATLVLFVVLTSSVVLVSVAAADLRIEAFDARVERADGSLETQAGAHPYQAVADFTLNANAAGLGPEETIKTVVVDLPAGFVGNPQAVGQCARAKFLAFVTGAAGCSPDTQVGEITITDLGYGYPNPQTYAVYNLVPGKQDVADFGFLVGGVPTHLIPRVRSGSDYGVSIDVSRISQEIPAWASKVVFWGQPADPSHDARRSCDGSQQNLGCASSGAPRPFLTNPSVCGPRFDTAIRMDSWQDPGDFKTAVATTPTPATGCEKLSFAPTVTVRPDSSSAGIPSGYAIDVAVPQNDNPNGLGTPPLKNAVVTLPAGVRISPSSAEGLGGCSDEQIGLRSLEAPACPEASKIGGVTVDTPVLDEPLTGDIYLGQPKSNDSQSGDMFRIFLTAAARGVQIKLEGKIVPDPVTGQLKTTFSDNPQLPFDKLTVRFKGGPRAPLTNPSSCGTHTTTAALTPWSSTTPVTVTVTSPIVIDRGCESAGAFAPSLSAGSTNPVAGASSSFALDLARPDGQQDIAGLDAVLPAGLLGNIAGVAQCPEAQAAAGTCDAASQIGRVAAASGAGANPLWLPQPGKAPTAVYLAGPYKGAPFSLSIVVPAQAGPFDLGTVVVRAALFIDPLDAHVTARADPLPTILSGVPLQLGRIIVTIDRAGFMRNPTSCVRKTINGVATSVAGATAAVASRFQVGDCASLALKPTLALSLSGKGQTTDGKHPAVIAAVSQPAGQANLKKVRVALPLSLALDTDNANGLCEFVDGSTVTPTCPKASIVGTATATTPILDEPLTGPVYFVKNVRKDPKSGRDIRTLPKLVIPMVGQNGVKLTLTGTSDVEDDQLVTTFDSIPDAPVSSFKLSINGGKGGILAVSDADICKSTQIAEQEVDGQNNKAADADVFIQTPSCPLKVLSKKVGKSSVAVKVGGLGAGKVTVSGKGIKKTSKTITKSTVATITAKRTEGKPAKVTVSFDPAGPAKARKTTK